MVELHFLALMIFVSILGSSLYGYYVIMRNRTESHSTPVVILLTAILFDLLEIVCKLLHYSFFAYDGQGLIALEVFAVIFQIISQFTVVTLLLLIASGWTITFDTVPDKDLYIPIGLVVLIVHLMMGGLVFVDRDDIDKHYDFSGVQGFVLVLMRIGLFVLF